ncbi:hypothetical protein R3P38DRAFT_2551435 [Favolaschia claudopus]|uniref:Uncharacterized protein n=1 Tax=Favolaschia claudopus TaxID=2862362 RepID=A0AAW0AHU6_9AGAR
MQRTVRENLEKLVNKNVQLVPAVSEEERKQYEEEVLLPLDHVIEATSPDYFRIDILGTPRSAWNKSAARVFTKWIIEQLGLPNTLETVKAIQSAFSTHVDTIIRKYKESLKSSAERIYLKMRSRRQTRKYQLFHRRRYLAYVFAPLRRHINMLERIGVDGMSSDESDTDETDAYTSEYQILAPIWRAQCVTAWLRMFDSIHNILKRSGNITAAQGTHTRYRRSGQRQSASIKFVPGLPINCYHPQWVNADLRRKFDLHPKAEAYDFNHSDDILE